MITRAGFVAGAWRLLRWAAVACAAGWAGAFLLWLPWMLTDSKAAADMVQPVRNRNPNESMTPMEYWGWIRGLYAPSATALAIAGFVVIVMIGWILPSTWRAWRWPKPRD
ncbi:hypothetical protein AESSP_02215 [Aestuariimicrobium sp. T2.26MG-19.2B]|nr:hypothetical protein AESSP_02215 [Aestuariimicrobium sp. T2.26MG-19.2B]